MPRAKILIFEDKAEDKDLFLSLFSENYDLKIVECIGEFEIESIDTSSDLIIINDNSNTNSGIALYSSIRRDREAHKIPVIYTYTQETKEHNLLLLNLGVEDIFVKPFDSEFLRLKIENRLRNRSYLKNQDTIIQYGEYSLDTQKMLFSFQVEGKETQLHLNPKENRLINLFLQHPGRIFRRNEIISYVWGEETHVIDRNVDICVSTLKKKLGSHAHIIETVYGAGYRLQEIIDQKAA